MKAPYGFLRVCLLIALAWLPARRANADSVLHSFGVVGSDGTGPGASLVLVGSTLYGTTCYGGSYGYGTIYKINTDGGGYQVVYNFGNALNDGQQPCSPLTLVGSTLWGTTSAGGSNGDGTIFEINADGTGYNIVYNFGTGMNDGQAPYSALTRVGSALYGTTWAGGDFNEGAIFEINADGAGYQVLYSFGTVSDDGQNPYASLTLVGSTLYGTTTAGGGFAGLFNDGGGTVFQINTDGSGYQVLYGFGGTDEDGLTPYSSLICVGSTLYGTTLQGGAAGEGAANDGTIYQINTDGSGYQVLYNFGISQNDGISPNAALVLTGTTLCGTTSLGGSNRTGTVYEINPNGTGYTVLYDFGSVEQDGAQPAAALLVSGTVPYGTTSFGGANGGGTVFSLGPEPAGSLQVSILPADAVSAGAKWTLDGGAARASGATVSGIPIGTHTVGFISAAGYIPPSSQSISIVADQPALTTGTYATSIVGPVLTSYWPLFDGDQKTFVYDDNQILTMTITALGDYAFSLQESSPDGSVSLDLSEDASDSFMTGVGAGLINISFSPEVLLLDADILQNGGTVKTSTTVSQSGVNYPATFTVTVSDAGTVTVPAGVFGNCRSIVSTEVAKVPGQGTITASGLTAYLAPGVGIIKTLVTVGHWAELVSGTVGGLAITPPGILVEDRTGNAFLSGSSTLNFSTVPVSAAGNYPITVLNSGTAALTNLAASITGDNASMFHAGPLGATTLSSGSSTTFNTSFAPTAAGPASAVLHVTSSDPKTPSYDIALAGAGIVSLASQAGVFTGLLDGDKGFITLTLSATGKFTGHLLLGGTAYTISGTAMDGYGDFTGTTGKTPKPPLTIAFHLALPAAAGSVGDYFLTGSAGNATFECTHSAYAKGLTLSGTGKYTVLLEFAEEGYPFPEGVGYAAMTVGSTGGIALAGKLADGLPFSASAIMLGGSAKNQCVIYTPLPYPSIVAKGMKGSLAGTLVFGPDAGASALSGTLDWVKPAQSKGDYPAAFDATLIAAGSPYKPPGRGDSALPGFTAGTLALSDTAGFVLSPAVSLTASDKLEITGADKDSLKVALTPATGLFTGAFIYPGQKAPTVFGGVLLQDQVRGAGLFLGPDGSGAVSLTPGP